MKIHVVQKGDTLWKIAKKYGVNFEQLKKMNTQLSNPDMIMPGMKIKVPSSGGTIKKEASAGTKNETQINFGTKEMPIVEHPFAKEKPKEMPVEEITPQVLGVQDIAPDEEAPIQEMPKPEPLPKAKPQPKPQAKPQPKAQAKPQPKTQIKPQQKPVKPIQQAKKPLPKPVIPEEQMEDQFIMGMQDMQAETKPQLPPKSMNIMPQLKPVLPADDLSGENLMNKQTLKGGVQEPMFNPNFFPNMYNMPQAGAVSPFAGGQMPFSGLPGVPMDQMDYQGQFPHQPNYPPQVMGMEDDAQMPLMPESGNFPQMPMTGPMMMPNCPPMYPISPVLPGPGPVPGYFPHMHMPMHMPMYPISPVLPGPGPVPGFNQPMQDYSMPQVAGESFMPSDGNMPHQGNFPPMMTEPSFAGGNDCGCGTPAHGHAFPGQFGMGGYGFPQGMMPYGNYGFPQGMMGVRHDWQSPNFDIDGVDTQQPNDELNNQVTAYPSYYGPPTGSMPYFNPYQPMGTWYPAFYPQRQQNEENENE